MWGFVFLGGEIVALADDQPIILRFSLEAFFIPDCTNSTRSAIAAWNYYSTGKVGSSRRTGGTAKPVNGRVASLHVAFQGAPALHRGCG